MKPHTKNRYINTSFWDDGFITNLDPIEKLLFLYLLTNPLTNIAGIYEIQIRRIAFDTGIDSEMVSKIINRFSEAEKVYYEDGYIVIKNFIKYQKLNDNMKKGIVTIVNLLPRVLQAKIKDRNSHLYLNVWKLLEAFESLTKPLNNTNTNTNVNTNKNLNINKRNSTSVELAAKLPVDKRNLDVQKVVEEFEHLIGKMPRPSDQRRAAQTLIQRHTLTRTLKAIEFLSNVRGMQYSPNIPDLRKLRDRWIELEDFGRKEANKQTKQGINRV